MRFLFPNLLNQHKYFYLCYPICLSQKCQTHVSHRTQYRTQDKSVHQQLSQFMYRNNLLNPFQSGLRPGYSTTSTLLKVTGDIQTGNENFKVTVLVLIDFSNAFNTVSHDVLVYLFLSYDTT